MGTVKRLFQSLLLSFVMTVLLILLLAFVMLQMQPDLKIAETGILVIYVLASFAGGWFCGRKAGARKFLWGLAAGILYFLILLATSVMGDRTLQSGITEGLTAFALCAAGGMCGGMLA